MPFKYDAFISYARASDQAFAAVVHSALQRFARSWTMRPALYVFLDKTSLSGSPSLSGALEKNLGNSSWLLLMASPESANSEWVQHELNWWLEHRSSTRLLILLTGGNIVWDKVNQDFDWRSTTALPTQLKGKITDEPLYVDLRQIKANQQFTLRSLLFRDAIATIAAPIHNKSKDELDGEDIRQHRKFIVIRRCVIGLLFILVIGLIILSGWSYIQKTKAIQNQINATANAAENAQNADMQIEALMAAVSAGKQLQGMVSPLRKRLHNFLDEEGQNESYANVASRLLQILLTFHEHNRLEQHIDAVTTLAYRHGCADGASFMVSGGKDGQVLLWGSEQMMGKKLDLQKPFALSYGGRVAHVDISPDCAYFAATGDLDNMLKIWQRDGRLMNTFKLDAEINALHYSPDGQFLVTGEYAKLMKNRQETGNIVLRDKSGNKIQEVSAFDSHILELKLQRCPNGEQLVVATSASLTSPLKFWHLADRLQPFAFPVPKLDANTKIKSISISIDCTIIAAGDNNGKIYLYSPNPIDNKTWQAYTGPVRSLDFSPNGQYLASGGETDSSAAHPSNDNTVKLWRLNGEAAATFAGHQGAVNAVVFSSDSKTIVSASSDKTLRVWNTQNMLVKDNWPWSGSAINAMISPDGLHVAAILTDNTLEIADVSSHSKTKTLLANAANVKPYFNVNNRVYLLDKMENTLSELNSTNNVISGYNQKVVAIEFNPDGRSVALMNEDHSITLLNLVSRKTERLSGLNADASTFAFSPNGKLLAAVAIDDHTKVKILTTDGVLAAEFSVQSQQPIKQLVFSPDSKTLAPISNDRLVKLWRFTGQALGTLSHASSVSNIAFHPEGRMLASSDFTGNVTLWSTSGRSLTHFNTGSKTNIWALQFSRDGKSLVAASMDAITRWNVDLTDLIQRGCQALDAYLTTDHPTLSKQDKEICRPR